MSIAAVISVDLAEVDHRSPEADLEDRRRLDVLTGAPKGCRVRLRVGTRRWPTPSAAEALHVASERLRITLDADDAATVRSWLEAIETGAVL